MKELNFQGLNFAPRLNGDGTAIFDPVRKKMVALTPEEWVRQHLIAALVQFSGVPLTLIGIEKKLVVNKLIKRFDVVVFSRQGAPLLLAECKAPEVTITEAVFDQAARYNLMLKANYFLITNGLQHYICQLDYVNHAYIFVEQIPHVTQMDTIIR